MSAPMALKQFTNFLYATQDLHFRNTRSKYETVYTEYTKKGPTENADHRSITSVGLGKFAATSEYGQFHKDSFAEGETLTATWGKFTNGFTISEELLDDMASNKRIYEDKEPMFKDMNQQLKDGWEWTKEVICAQFLSSGASATQAGTWPGAGRDGLALASASHVTLKSPTVTNNNIMVAGPISQLAIQDGITILENMVTDEGRPQGPITEVGLLFGRYWQWRVAEVLGTDGQVDTANNNINTLVKGSKKIKIVPILIPYLSNTSTVWGLVDLKQHKLTRYQKLDVRLSREKDISTGALIVKGTGRFGIHHLSYHGYARNAG